MNLFGIQLGETIEVFGVPFVVSPALLLIAALPLVFLLALLTYWLTQRATSKSAYKSDYDFYNTGKGFGNKDKFFFDDIDQETNRPQQPQFIPPPSAQPQFVPPPSAQPQFVPPPSTQQPQFMQQQMAEAQFVPPQFTEPQINHIDVEDEITEPVKVPSFYTTAPAYLIYINGGNHLPKKLPLDGNAPIRVGRKKSSCELVLDDRRVSRFHSVIFQADGEFYIEDEGSAGGTFVNRRKLDTVESKKLEHNDVVHFNEVEYRFEVTTETIAPMVA